MCDGRWVVFASVNRGEVKIQEIEIGLPRVTRDDPHVSSLIFDDKGILWAGAISGLYRRTPNGRAQRFTKSDGLPDNYVQSNWLDRAGRLWFGTRKGGFFSVRTAFDGLKLEPQFAQRDGLPGRDVRAIFRSFDDKLWIGTEGGLSEMLPATKDGRSRFLNYTTANGLSENQTYKLGEDRDGNLWLGTFQGGVGRIARPGFITYDAVDGFHPISSNNLFETQSGDLGVYSGNVNDGDEYPATFHLFDGQHFSMLSRGLPERIHEFGNGGLRFALLDHRDEYWLATLHGLLHLPKVAGGAPSTYLPARRIDAKRQSVLLSYEDARGDLWMETYNAPAGGPWFVGNGQLAGFNIMPVLRACHRSETIAQTLSAKMPPGICGLALSAMRGWYGIATGNSSRFRPLLTPPLATSERSSLITHSGCGWQPFSVVCFALMILPLNARIFGATQSPKG